MKAWWLGMLAAAMVPGGAAAQVIGPDAAACTSNRGPAVLVHVQGLKDRKGNLKLELYPATADDFLKDDRDLLAQGKTFRRVQAPTPPSGNPSLCMRVAQAGRYALLLIHDRDGKNKFSFWSDGAGFVSQEKIGRKRPKVEQAVVQIGPGVTTLTIRLQYLRGLGGFGPVDPD
ncbi:DUF2141 domain-containing protein [uncultured Sphingomonas sp.]|uniref:DUF2141 domain-containing protein n=1 Tax=uncultured Sphingomonas sp. TaxID=158754 RepID=UPI00261FB01C|nr:DUF2141 domain-containing protein [uncultured Sphingomonas sp.]